MELKRFLLPTDFSEFANEAVQYACLLVDRFGGELHLLHVIHDLSTDLPSYGGGTVFPAYLEKIAEHRDELEQQAIAKLTKILYPGWEQGRRVVIATRQGNAFVQIVQYAKEHMIDMIIMGTHGRSGLAHAMIGSVAEHVVRKASCPVLTIRPKDHRFQMP